MQTNHFSITIRISPTTRSNEHRHKICCQTIHHLTRPLTRLVRTTVPNTDRNRRSTAFAQPSTPSTTLSITRTVVRLLWCSVSIWQRLSRRFRSTPRRVHVSFWCTLSHLLTHSSFDHLFVTFWLNRDYPVQPPTIARFAPPTPNSRNTDLVVDFPNHPLPPSTMLWRSIPHLRLRRFLDLQSAHSNCVRHTLHNSQLNMVFQASQAAQFKKLSRSTCSSTSCNSGASRRQKYLDAQ